MSPSYYKRRREKVLERSRKGVLARERKRLERAEVCGAWRRVATVLLVVHAAPDGRHVAMRTVLPQAGAWERSGCERAVRAALAKALWKGGRRA